MISEWHELDRALRQLSKDELQPFRALETLRTVPSWSPLYALGLFALIESIVTHNPHDRFDSLTHQVSTKMFLLSKRFRRSLPYNQFSRQPVDVWKRLYEYRSCVAHGKTPDFKTGRLATLQSEHVAVKFVMESAKLLLIQLLTERSLLQDLKEC